ncbi:hypothetical protein ACN20G_06295 [Streptomyces sp. BI20]|uniref:hypothetical protein n=1 Tax=Streptomyces sp. BI20 TaxID=3403460 RepID=UPI003C713729
MREGTVELRAVVEAAFVPAGFGLWPVADAIDAFDHVPLHGGLDEEALGTVLYTFAVSCPHDPDEVFADPAARVRAFAASREPEAPGGLWCSDGAGRTWAPGCCSGIEEWREGRRVLASGPEDPVWFGHSPSAHGARVGDRVLLTVDAEEPDGPVIELDAEVYARLLDGVEGELREFLGLVEGWARRVLPAPDRGPFVAAVARLVDLSIPGREGSGT